MGRLETLAYGLPTLAYMYTVGSVGFWLPLYAESLGYSYTQIQLLATVYFLVLTPATLASGVLADRSGRPGLLAAAGMVLNAASTVVMALANSYPMLLASRVVQALGLSTAMPVTVGALSLSRGVRRGVGSAGVITASGMALGSVAGGLLVEASGFRAVFYSAAAVSLAAAAVALATRFPRPPAGRGVLEGLRRVPASVWAVLAGLAARNTLATGVYSVLSIVFHSVIGLSILGTALALSVNPVVQASAAMPISRAARGRELAWYTGGLAATSLVFQLYLHARSLPEVIAAQVVQGVSFASINVAGNMYIIGRSPREIRYTASSLFGLAFNLGWITGTLVAGPYMDSHGPSAWIMLASMLIPLVALATYVSAWLLEKRFSNSSTIVDNALSRLSTGSAQTKFATP